MNFGDLYLPGDSWLHRADPRLKMGLALAAATLLLSYNNLFIMALSLTAVVAVLRGAGVPWARLRAIARLMVPVVIVIPLLWPIFYQSGPTILVVWKLRLTAWALAQGVTAALRIVALGYVSIAVLLTTDIRALLRGLVQVGLPFEAALTVTIALSYIPRIQRTYEQVTEAQMARGFDVNAGNLVVRARARVPILVASLVSTFRSADTMARALECRGFGRTDVARTSYFRIHWRPSDTAVAVGAGLFFLIALSARVVLGFGSHPLLLL